MGMDANDTRVTNRWLVAHRELLISATNHPFIVSIRDGSIQLEAFKHWLGQDYFFVRSFVRFIASVLIKLPKDAAESDVDLVLGGLTALEQEIAWFRSEATKFGLQLGCITRQKENLDYCMFLEELSNIHVHYAVMLTAFWAIEMVYNESFATCIEIGTNTPAELQDACKRWGNAEFQAYCMKLQQLAEKYLQTSSAAVQKQAEQAFLNVLSHEVEFWNMSQQTNARSLDG